MNKIQQPRTVMLDVDDSIILWTPENYAHDDDELLVLEDDGKIMRFLPHYKNIEFVKTLKFQGYGIVCWSAAGVDWAERIVKALHLEEYIDVCMSKPEFAIDDLLQADRIIKSVLWIDPKTGEYKRNE